MTEVENKVERIKSNSSIKWINKMKGRRRFKKAEVQGEIKKDITWQFVQVCLWIVSRSLWPSLSLSLSHSVARAAACDAPHSCGMSWALNLNS